MANSTRRRRTRNHQSAKPHPDYPLTAHPSGRWCKKIKGRTHCFGPLADPDAALNKRLREKGDLLAGRIPRDQLPPGTTLRDLANAFLRHKQGLMQNGELSPRTFADAHRTCKDLLNQFGKHRRIDDLRQQVFAEYRVELAKRLGLVALGNAIRRVRSVFKFAMESGLATTPILFGPGFKRPSKKTLRIERAKKGPKLFAPDELRRLIVTAGVPLKAMILLACNAGLGNSDLANMTLSAINLKSGWVDYPRVKTGVPRRFPLWPETVKALRDVLAKRPAPKGEADAAPLFITKYGARWCKGTFELNSTDGQTEAGENEKERKPRTNNDNEITKEFNKLFPDACVERWAGRSFYTLRHVFETIGGESRDQVAVDYIMGHARDDMASVYRERVRDDRLEAVVMHVRGWLFPKKPAKSRIRAS